MKSDSLKINIPIQKDMPSAEVLILLLKSLWNIFLINLDGVKRDIDIEFLHDLRVSIRRIRAALSLIKNIFSEEVTRQLKEDSRYIGNITGSLRDLDVLFLKEEMYNELICEKSRAGHKVFFNWLKNERQREHEKLSKEMSSSRFEEIIIRWENLFLNGKNIVNGSNRETPIGTLAESIILKQFKAIGKARNKQKKDASNKNIHSLRIEYKKIRYLTEFFKSLYPAKTFDLFIKNLKNLQDALGEFNDCFVHIEFFQRFLEKPPREFEHDNQYVAALGGLISTLAQKQLSLKKDLESMLNKMRDDKKEIKILVKKNLLPSSSGFGSPQKINRQK